MIELDDICRDFHVGDSTVHALDQVTLTIHPGEYLSVMGPSGSGKSTLLNVLGLLDQPSSGHYRLDGHDTTSLTEAEQARVRREKIGFVFQTFQLVPRLTAAENVELPMLLAGFEPADRHARADVALEQLGLNERAQHRPDQLSGGQRQRVAIARAIVMQPAILLADEPTGNLDRHSGGEVVDTLEALNATGITLLVVTHDPALGARARRRLRMEDGAIVGDESPTTAPAAEAAP